MEQTAIFLTLHNKMLRVLMTIERILFQYKCREKKVQQEKENKR